MPLRKTIIGAVMVLALCIAMFVGVTSYFGHGIGERGNEFPFREGRVNGPERVRDMDSNVPDPLMTEKPIGRVESGRVIDSLEEGFSEQEPHNNLDSWYADAGSKNGPVDAAPADNSFLINSAEPYTSTEPR